MVGARGDGRRRHEPAWARPRSSRDPIDGRLCRYLLSTGRDRGAARSTLLPGLCAVPLCRDDPGHPEARLDRHRRKPTRAAPSGTRRRGRRDGARHARETRALSARYAMHVQPRADLHYWGVTELATRLDRGEITSADVTTHLLARI